MNCTIDRIEDVAVVLLPGDALDASNSEEFKNDVETLLDENTQVVLDLSRLRFVDSSGCGALLSCLRRMKSKGGDLKLCGLSSPVRTLFELIRMHRIIDIFDEREEAVRAF